MVAYTYNREAQAQQKVASVAAKHPELKPEVFTPEWTRAVSGGGWWNDEPG